MCPQHWQCGEPVARSAFMYHSRERGCNANVSVDSFSSSIRFPKHYQEQINKDTVSIRRIPHRHWLIKSVYASKWRGVIYSGNKAVTYTGQFVVICVLIIIITRACICISPFGCMWWHSVRFKKKTVCAKLHLLSPAGPSWCSIDGLACHLSAIIIIL